MSLWYFLLLVFVIPLFCVLNNAFPTSLGNLIASLLDFRGSAEVGLYRSTGRAVKRLIDDD